MIHRAPFGSMERFTAVLIEHTSGHFPLWLTPDQVVVLPLSEKYNDYAKQVLEQFNQQGVRGSIDLRNEKLGRKIRDNELKRIPYREGSCRRTCFYASAGWWRAGYHDYSAVHRQD